MGVLCMPGLLKLVKFGNEYNLLGVNYENHGNKITCFYFAEKCLKA